MDNKSCARFPIPLFLPLSLLHLSPVSMPHILLRGHFFFSPSSVSIPFPPLPQAFSSMQAASQCLRPRAWLGVTAHAPSAPLPLHPHPPSASGPRPLLSVSFSPITSPDTDTPLLQFPRFQLWSPAPATRGKMGRGEARGEGEGQSILHPEINKPGEGAA